MAIIKRVSVMKMASFMALYGFFIGLIFAIISLLFSAVFSGIFPSGLSFLGGAIFLIAPVIYAILGFIGGIILTPIINLTLKITKGINLDIELGGQTY